MKTFTKGLLTVGLLSIGLANAQSADMRNMLKVGVNVGAAVPKGNTSAALGLDLSYQNLVSPGFGLGLATGYTHYLGKKNKVGSTEVDNNDFGIIPAALLVRFYPKQTGFYAGTDLGYGFIVGDDKVTTNNVATNNTVTRPDGGFYIKPEIGYHNRDWNFYLQYQKVFTGDNGKFLDQKYNAGSLGVGVAYNIPLGK